MESAPQRSALRLVTVVVLTVVVVAALVAFTYGTAPRDDAEQRREARTRASTCAYGRALETASRHPEINADLATLSTSIRVAEETVHERCAADPTHCDVSVCGARSPSDDVYPWGR
jgi:hypothetical protein